MSFYQDNIFISAMDFVDRNIVFLLSAIIVFFDRIAFGANVPLAGAVQRVQERFLRDAHQG